MAIGANGRGVAAITGATSGFGKIYAERLASEGFDLLIIARRGALLEELKVELEARFQVEVEPMVADLSRLEQIEQVERRLESLAELRYLINNAGFGGSLPFPDVDVTVETDMVTTHCLAPMRLTRAALVPMRSRGLSRGAGYIVNVSSAAGFLAGSGAADYCGTKSYLITFSRCVQCDVRGFGVRVQALCPGFAHTGFHAAPTMRNSKIPQTVPRFLWQRADRVVDASLRSLRRKFRPNVVCIPTWKYKIACYFGSSWLFAPLRLLFSGGKIR
ncbi:MAG: SDR family NAD(P)-dependent oxidoreductase [Planctomycetia bacterium]|nr:SDR family NAD(P)-dependent oxidoreductase [Planctomycetia bacterium]